MTGAKKGAINSETVRGRDAATVLKVFGEFSAEHLRQSGEIRSCVFLFEFDKR
ncbi:MAG: hypothetical protein ABR999_01655 [Methanoregula sp.]|uniref:hypothetical protein n=1 Tax=Methanoregula sp. TaxID=2052170 RepID=UPI003D10674D